MCSRQWRAIGSSILAAKGKGVIARLAVNKVAFKSARAWKSERRASYAVVDGGAIKYY